ncbi:MAG TPA: hypothetical protein PK823_19375 [Novosphingobium sp.]|nr:hypothetical protein [Novosphingobium sp.]
MSRVAIQSQNLLCAALAQFQDFLLQPLALFQLRGNKIVPLSAVTLHTEYPLAGIATRNRQLCSQAAGWGHAIPAG